LKVLIADAEPVTLSTALSQAAAISRQLRQPTGLYSDDR